MQENSNPEWPEQVKEKNPEKSRISTSLEILRLIGKGETGNKRRQENAEIH